MSIPRQMRELLDMSIESQMQLSIASRGDHRAQVEDCLPNNHVYRDRARMNDGTPCLPRGLIDTAHPNCCQYQNGIPFHLMLLEIFEKADRHNAFYNSLRVRRLHYWLRRKYRRDVNPPPELMLDERYAFIDQWMTLLPKADYWLMRVKLRHEALTQEKRTNLSAYVYDYMNPELERGVLIYCDGRVEDNVAIHHVLRFALQSERQQFVKFACNAQPFFISTCINHLLAAPGPILNTTNDFRFDFLHRFSNDLTLTHVLTKMNNWISLHENQNVGQGIFTIRLTPECVLDYYDSDWRSTHGPLLGFVYGETVDFPGQTWSKTCTTFTVTIYSSQGQISITINT